MGVKKYRVLSIFFVLLIMFSSLDVHSAHAGLINADSGAYSLEAASPGVTDGDTLPDTEVRGDPDGSQSPEEPGGPEESGNPEEPGEPEESSNPEEPGEPEESSNPEEPGEPDASGNPGTDGVITQPAVSIEALLELAATDGAAAAARLKQITGLEEYLQALRAVLDFYYADGAVHEHLAAFAPAVEERGAALIAGYAAAYQERSGKDLGYVPGQALVMFKGEVDEDGLQSLLADGHGKITYALPVGGDTLAVVELPLSHTVEQAIAEYETGDAVLYAQPNYIYQSVETPVSGGDGLSEQSSDQLEDDLLEVNQLEYDQLEASAPESEYQSIAAEQPDDSGLVGQWHHSGIGTFEAWKYISDTSASGRQAVTVAVIDQQIKMDHEDLQGNLLSGALRNFQASTRSSEAAQKQAAKNPGELGTHVAGLIGAVANNSKGVAGIAGGMSNNMVKILPVNVFRDGDSDIAETIDIILGVNYAAKYGAKVILISIYARGDTYKDSGLEKAINAAHDKGAVVIAPGGFSNSDTATYPSDYGNVMSVISVTKPEKIAWELGKNPRYKYVVNGATYGSSYGKKKNISAPGENLYSTLTPSVAEPTRLYGTRTGSYPAASVVAGAAALVFYADPALTNTDVAQILYKSATDVHTAGWDDQTGWGVVNAEKAVKMALGIDSFLSAPGSVTVSNGGLFKAKVNWGKVADASGYRIYRKLQGDADYAAAPVAEVKPASTITYTDDTVIPGEKYIYKVHAYKGSMSVSGPKESAAFTVPAVAAPTNFKAVLDNKNGKLTWTAVKNAAEYVLYRKIDSADAYTTLATGIKTSPYTDTSALWSNVYQYRIAVRGPKGQEGTFTAPVTLEYRPAAPPKPALAVNGVFSIAVTLTPKGGVTYKIYRKLSSEGSDAFTEVYSGTSEKWTDASLNPNTKYSYAYSVVEGGIESLKSPVVEAVTGKLPAIASIRAVPESPTSIKLTWSAVQGVYGYHAIIEGDNSSDALFVGNVLTYTWSGLEYGNYTLAVCPVFQPEEGRIVNGDYKKTGVVRPAETTVAALTANIRNPYAIELSWPSLSNAQKYSLLRYDDMNTLPTVVGTVSPDVLKLTDSSVKPGKTYYYTVMPYWLNGTTEVKGKESPRVTARLAMQTPSGLTGTATRPTSVRLSWKKLDGADGYDIYFAGNSYEINNADIITKDIDDANPNTAYSAMIRAYWGGSGGSDKLYGSYSAPVTVTTAGSAPANLSRDSLTETSVRLKWNPVSDANVTGYLVTKDSDVLNAKFINGTEYSDKTLTPGIPVKYTVQACWGANGTKPGVPSPALTVTPPSAVPGKVKGAVLTPTSIRVTWNAVNSANRYTAYIYEKNALVQSQTVTAATCDFAGLNPNTQYQIKVAGVWNAADSGSPPVYREGKLSSAANIKTTGPAPSKPKANDLTATSVRLTWDFAQVTGVTGYLVTKTGAAPQYISLAKYESDKGYIDDSLNPGMAVKYTVQACWSDMAGYKPGAASAALSLTPPGKSPTGIKAAPLSPTSIRVVWNTVPDADGHRVYYGEAYKDFDLTPGAKAYEYIFESLEPNTQYQFRVAGLWNTAGDAQPPSYREGKLSPAVKAKTTGPAPAKFRAGDLTATSVRLTWNPVNDANVVGYRITKNGKALPFIPVDTYYKSYNSYLDEELCPGVTVKYTVQACWANDAMPGAVSSTLTVNPKGTAPGNIKAEILSPESIMITWSEIDGAASYKAYINSQSYAVPAGDLQYTFTGLTPNKEYQVQVEGVFAAGSQKSAAIKVRTTGPTPAGFEAADITATSVRLIWDEIPDASGYLISKNGDAYEFITSAAYNGGYVDDTLEPNVSVKYTVQAYWSGAGGVNRVGPPSPAITVKPR